MNRLLTAVGLVLLATPYVGAYIGTPVTAAPLHIRVGLSDLIALGKVEQVDREPSLLEHPFAQSQKPGLYIGTVTLTEVIHGDRSLKSVKVAAPFYYVTIDYDKYATINKRFKPQKHAPALKTFRKGRQGLFFLRWNPIHQLYTLAHDPLFVDRDDPVFTAELERTRYFARLLRNPRASLQAKDENDRATTAALLVYRYRWPRADSNAEVPIDAEESKLILSTLAEAKWDLYPNDFRMIQMNQCFNVLGSQGQSGWVGSAGLVFAEPQVKGAKAWLARNRESFRIHKYTWDLRVLIGKADSVLPGHTNTVRSVAFSPDGKRLASASDDKTVKVWDMSNGRAILTLKGHTDAVRSVVFSPDGKRLVSGSLDRTVKVWDAQTGKVILTLEGPTETIGTISFVALSPDGQRIVANDGNRNLLIWDARTGQQQLTLKGHTNVVLGAAFSPDGKRLVSGGHDNRLIVWDAQTGQEILKLEGHSSGVRSVAVSPDGKSLVSGSDDRTVKVWDAQTGKEKRTLRGHAGWVLHVAFSPDGKRLVSGGADRVVKLWDAQSGLEIVAFSGHSSGVTGVAFRLDGRRLASSCGDPLIRIWDTRAAP